MFGFLKNKLKLFEMKRESGKYLYRIEYIPICKVTDGKCEFRIANMNEAYVFAGGIISAGTEFAKHYVLSPHVCIFRISRCENVLNQMSTNAILNKR